MELNNTWQLIILGISIFFSGVLIPSIPLLIITWYKAKRNHEKIEKLFKIVDVLQKEKAEREETDKRISSIANQLQKYAIAQASNIATFKAMVERFEKTEKRFETHIDKTS
jgi:hypothetical protein